MTIAAGVRCSDGIVLAADTEFNGSAKRYRTKVRAWQWADPDISIAVTGAGDAIFLSRVSDEIRERVKPDVKTMPDVVRMVENVLAEMHYKHIYPRPKTGSEDDELRLLVAVRAGRYLQLFENNTTVLARVERSQCVGFGSPNGLMAMGSLLEGARPDIVFGELVAIYAVHAAKTYSPYCGGDTHVAILPRAGEVVARQANETAAFDDYLRAFDHARRTLLLAYANPLASDARLSKRLAGFQAELMDARNRLLSRLPAVDQAIKSAISKADQT